MRSNLNNIEDEDNGRIPFILYILSNALLPIVSALLQFDEYVRRMRFFSGAQQYSMNAHSRILEAFSDYLGEEAHLRDFEQFLNAMGIACKLKTCLLYTSIYKAICLAANRGWNWSSWN